MTDRPQQRKPIDIAADLLFYAPVGIALEVGKQLPDLARQGRETFGGPIAAARIAGQFAVQAGKKDLSERLRKVAEPYMGSAPNSTSAAPSATPTSPVQPTTGEIPTLEQLAIPAYDTLPASEIMSHLKGLSIEQLTLIEAFERAHRARRSVLARIETLKAGS